MGCLQGRNQAARTDKDKHDTNAQAQSRKRSRHGVVAEHNSLVDEVFKERDSIGAETALNPKQLKLHPDTDEPVGSKGKPMAGKRKKHS